MKNRRVHFALLAALCLATIVAAVRPSRATIGNVSKSDLATGDSPVGGSLANRSKRGARN